MSPYLLVPLPPLLPFCYIPRNLGLNLHIFVSMLLPCFTGAYFPATRSGSHFTTHETPCSRDSLATNSVRQEFLRGKRKRKREKERERERERENVVRRQDVVYSRFSIRFSSFRAQLSTTKPSDDNWLLVL